MTKCSVSTCMQPLPSVSVSLYSPLSVYVFPRHVYRSQVSLLKERFVAR